VESEIPITKFQAPNKFQLPITKHLVPIGIWELVIIWLLACLREAASAKAGAWLLVIVV